MYRNQIQYGQLQEKLEWSEKEYNYKNNLKSQIPNTVLIT